MSNSHYVPRLILRKFSDKLSLYNVKTGELKENIPPEHAYVMEDFYDEKTEKKLNLRIESQIGGILSNLILKCDKEISLSRMNLLLVKKFLMVSIIRSIKGEEWMHKEKSFYERCRIPTPFKEKQIDGETSFEYWLRTINVILDTDGTPQQILNHSDKTYPAYRWACIVNSAYLAFWDAPNEWEEFVITDIGMTSENEKSWDGVRVHNWKKLNYIKALIDITSETNERENLYNLLNAVSSFSENFQMFPISSKRMIVLILPFFKFRYFMKTSGKTIPWLSDLTMIPNEPLFEPNRNYYVSPPIPGKGYQYHDDDKYIYDIKTLNADEIRYSNALFMDRIDTYLGFSSLDHAVGSIIKYKKLNDPPYVSRVDYTELYKIIQKRYLGSLNI
ncbi:MAG: DUF4238 domain-containing protein [Clostridiales bacterium]|nr:DUF4238 domain-containing protein [Clostridiales bacterium]